MQLPFDIAPPSEKPRRLHHVRLAGGILAYRLVRAKRYTLGLSVAGQGIEVRAPRRSTLSDIDTFIREKERWIRKRLAGPRRVPFIWQAGAKLPWLGGIMTLVLRHGESGVWASEDELRFGLADGASLRERGLEWIRGQARTFFRERVDELSRRLGLHVSGMGLSDARTRWGSCGASGRVLLNWRLMLLPPYLIDYVVMHELAHLRELNHSPRFWAVVANLYPDHRSARRELNALARTLPEL